MSKTFRYIQNEDVLKSFEDFRDTVLKERPVVIARHGDYSLLLEKRSEDVLGLKIVNDEKKTVVSDRTYDIKRTNNELIARGVRHACQKMSELCDEDINRKRFQIWKWYLLDWQKHHADETQELIDREIEWDEEVAKTEADLMDMEKFLHGDYLNLGNTLSLIDTYLKDETHKEVFRKFAVSDIMEMTSEDTKVKSLEEAEHKNQKEELKLHTYQFKVSVEATDREHARQALIRYLGGDDRISVQK
ncbi:hypothetical protein [Butyrivibrio sp. YAB3001]|uniref:hypothetical protein n=1 Tax=Butyrivibrio sp. YAB3001 TaxID=1520812 RepID=UPI0008F6292E|nr:hypothetical protein [Butyrivibrio sp. YAB3001]SFC40859.1 hypothetical protein SAMN02910398_02182 [Butyrivibrio sp. YAB3001]